MNIGTYTNKQAMDKLHLTSRSVFRHLKRKYPQAFLIMNEERNPKYPILYDKQVLDKFVETLEALRRNTNDEVKH
jgi:hypothetical protein